MEPNLHQADPHAALLANNTTSMVPNTVTQDKRWAGKFPTAEELERGYENQQTAMTTVSRENAQLRQQLAAVMPLLENNVADRQNPTDRATSGGRISKFAEAHNMDPRDLIEALQEAAAPMFEAALAPIVNGIHARQAVAAKDPNYLTNEVKIAQFLTDNPETRVRFDRAIATKDKELAIMAYDYARLSALGSPAGAPTAPPESATGINTLESAIDGQLMGGSGGRVIPQGGASRGTQLDELRRRTADGDGVAQSQYIDLLLSAHIPPGHVRGQ